MTETVMSYILVRDSKKLADLFGDIQAKAQGANENERTFQAAMFDFWLRDWTEEEVSELFTISTSSNLHNKYKDADRMARNGNSISINSFGFDSNNYHIYKPDPREPQVVSRYLMDWFNTNRDWATILNNMCQDFPDLMTTSYLLAYVPSDTGSSSVRNKDAYKNSIFHHTILDRLVLLKNNFLSIDRTYYHEMYSIIKSDRESGVFRYLVLNTEFDMPDASRFLRNRSSDIYGLKSFFLNYHGFARHIVNDFMTRTYGGFMDQSMRSDKTPTCVFFKDAKDRQSIMSEPDNEIFERDTSRIGQVILTNNLRFGFDVGNTTVLDKPRVKNKVTKFSRAIKHIMRGVITDKMVEYTNMAVMEKFYARDMNDLTFNLSVDADAFYKATTGMTPKFAFNHTDSMIKSQSNSCMRHETLENGFHPSHAYATGDFYVGWLSCEETKDGKMYGRSYIGIQDMSKATDLFKTSVANTFGLERATQLKYVYVTGPCYTHADACAIIYFNKLKAALTSDDTEVAMGILSSFVTTRTGLKYIEHGWNNLRMQYGDVARNKQAIVFPYVDITNYSIGEPGTNIVRLVDAKYKPPVEELTEDQRKSWLTDSFNKQFNPNEHAQNDHYYEIVLRNEFANIDNFNPDLYRDVYMSHAKIDRRCQLGQPRFSGGSFTGSKDTVVGNVAVLTSGVPVREKLHTYTIDALIAAAQSYGVNRTSLSSISYVDSDIAKLGMVKYFNFSSSYSDIQNRVDFASVLAYHKKRNPPYTIHTYDGISEDSLTPTEHVVYGQPSRMSYSWRKDIMSEKTHLLFAKFKDKPLTLIQLPNKLTIWKREYSYSVPNHVAEPLDPDTDILVVGLCQNICSAEQSAKSVTFSNDNTIIDINGYISKRFFAMNQDRFLRTSYNVTIDGVTFRAVRYKASPYQECSPITTYRGGYQYTMPFMHDGNAEKFGIDISITQNTRVKTGAPLFEDIPLSDESELEII
jgi:hypothetical protein